MNGSITDRVQHKSASMDNYYASPKAQISEDNISILRWGLLFWLVTIGTSLLSLCLGLFGSFAMPSYAELFAGFGTEIPSPTLFALSHGRWLWLPSLATVLVWLKWFGAKRNKKTRKQYLLLFTSIGVANIAVMAGEIWAMYLPIFNMGDAVR